MEKFDSKYFIVLLTLVNGISISSVKAECAQNVETTQNAYIGWPVYLQCDEAYSKYYEAFYYDHDYFEDDVDLTCTIVFPGTNEVLLNETANFLEISDIRFQLNISSSTQKAVEILVQSPEGCVKEAITLKITSLPDYECANVPKNNKNTVTRELTQGDSGKVLLCQMTSQSDEPEIDVFNFDVTWYYNCNTTLPPDVDISNHELTFSSVNFKYHPGKFSCSVNENNQTRFIVFHEICVKPRRWSSFVSISCPKEQKYDIGDDVNMTCNVNIGEGTYDRTKYVMNFNRLLSNGSVDISKDNISCTSDLGDTPGKAPDERVSCLFVSEKNASQDDFKCFAEVPTQEEWEAEKNKTLDKLVIVYQIKNVQKPDFGTFRGFVRNSASNVSDTDNTVISQNIDPIGPTIPVLWIAIGLVLGLVLIVVSCLIFWIEITWMWKHYFAKYDQDVRRYGAYLTYFWTNEHEAIPQYESLIDNMKNELGRLNSPIYDSQHNPAIFEWNTENVHLVQQMCDRIIIILTEEYLNEEDNNFEIYTNFLHSSFIFIKTPGIDEGIRRMNADRRHGIKAALRRNYVISWNGGRPTGRFKRRLELALPKRMRENTQINTNGAVIYENGNDINLHNGNGHSI